MNVVDRRFVNIFIREALILSKGQEQRDMQHALEREKLRTVQLRNDEYRWYVRVSNFKNFSVVIVGLV